MNNFEYISKNYQFITDSSIQNVCFLIAYMYAKNFDIIDFIVKNFNIDRNTITKKGNNGIHIACQNRNLALIQYLYETIGIDSTKVNESHQTCLIVACLVNCDLDVIKYLIENTCVDIYEIDSNGNNCLHIVSMKNRNLNVIRYLIEEVKMDINIKNYTGLTCSMLACDHNTNLKIIKYLIEVDGIPNYIDNKRYICLYDVHSNSPNIQIIKYLVD